MDYIDVAEVVQEKAARDDIEAALAKRQAEGIGGEFRQGRCMEIAQARVTGEDGRQGEVTTQGASHVAGCRADIEYGKGIARRIIAGDFRAHDRMSPQPAVDLAEVAKVGPRLVIRCCFEQFPLNYPFLKPPHDTYVKLSRVDIVTVNTGWIEVICGPMFSGKSEELIRRLRRAMIARKRVQVFKPIIDDRYSADEIVSHADQRMKSEVVSGTVEILARLDWRTQVVGIDEANFMGEGLVQVASQLADAGKQVIVAGLDTDYMGRPFAPIPELLALAESITKTLAICMRCGNPAKHTQRLVESNDLIVVGAAGMYEARCRRCFEPGVPKQETFEFARPRRQQAAD